MSEICNVLIVESDQKTVEIASPILLASQCKVSYAKQGLNVVTHLLKNEFNLVLLSDILPDEDGFRVLRRIREKEELCNIPVIMLLSSVDEINRAFKDGSTDYLIKPLSSVQVEARIKPYIINVKNKKRFEEESFKKEQVVKQLDQAFMEMEVMSRIDPLTSILNRRTFLEKIGDEQVRSRRNQKKFTLLLINIVNCRKYNDRQGYECGDFIIKKVAENIDFIVRERDFTARWSGDKFMILLPETEIDGVEILKEKISNFFGDTSFEYKGMKHIIGLSYSFKVCTGKDKLDDILKEIE
ncbi:MAG: diguanylate cyclase [Spirochaetaceae bacterium]|jgi:diguanylate cyclase (GGDEF)-like protein|nr:diguanylate cyclase [Spirochaetaceae bacterium]